MTTTPYSTEMRAAFEKLFKYPMDDGADSETFAMAWNAALSQQAAPVAGEIPNSDDEIAKWAEDNGAQVAWSSYPDMHHIIKMTPPELRLLLASQPHPTGDTQEHTLIVEHACLHQALEELVRLKDLKDGWGKTDEYERAQPLAWQAARDVLRTLEEPENLAMLMLRVSKGQTKAVTVPRDIAVRWYAKFAADLAGDTQQEAVAWMKPKGAAFNDVISDKWKKAILKAKPNQGLSKEDAEAHTIPLFTHPPEATALAQQVKYVGVSDKDCPEPYDSHPNDDEPRCEKLRARFKMMGNDEGQGLHPYWKWAFAAGYNACKLDYPIPEPRPDALVAMAWKTAAEVCVDQTIRFCESMNGVAAYGASECEKAILAITPPDAQTALEELLIDAVKRGMAFEEANHTAGTGAMDEDAREIVATLNQQKD